jgi:hypothetical protein
MADRPSAVLHLLFRMGGNGADGAAAPAAAQSDQRGPHRASPLHQLCRRGPGVPEAHRVGHVSSLHAELVRPRAASDAPADDARACRVRHDSPVARRPAGARHVALPAPPTSRRAALPDARRHCARGARVATPQDLASGVGSVEHVAGDRRRARVHPPVQVCRKRVERASAAGRGREAGRFSAQDYLVQGLHLARSGERGREAEAPRRHGVSPRLEQFPFPVSPLLVGWTSTSGVDGKEPN